jgi:carbon monoxide dehydrogenase subunit G
MDMFGEYSIAAPRETVWAALNDPQVLYRSIPGCEQIDRMSDTEFKARVVVKVGMISGTFRSKFRLSDLEPPASCTLAGQGTGAMGFASWQARVALSDERGDTALTYQLKAEVSGRLAQMGAGAVDSLTNQMADQFFDRFSALVAGEEPQPVPQALSLPFRQTLSGSRRLILATVAVGIVIVSLAYYLIAG